MAVAINHFTSDTAAEVEAIAAYSREHGVDAFRCTHWADGSKGMRELSRHVIELAEKSVSQFTPIYGDDMPLWEKIRIIAREIYRADDVVADKAVRDQLRSYEALGYGKFPDLHGQDPVFVFD